MVFENIFFCYPAEYSKSESPSASSKLLKKSFYLLAAPIFFICGIRLVRRMGNFAHGRYRSHLKNVAVCTAV